MVHEIEKLVGGISMFSHDSGRVSHGHDYERGFSDIAVLYRTNSLRRDLEEALVQSGIPFTVTGEKPFYADQSVSMLIGLLRFSAGEQLPAELLCSLFNLTPDQSSFLISGAAKTGSKHIDKIDLNRLMSSPETLSTTVVRSLTPILNTTTGHRRPSRHTQSAEGVINLHHFAIIEKRCKKNT